MYRIKANMSSAAENRMLEIIKVSLKLFAEKGYKSTSLDDVADKIGVTKATLYYYFRSKDEILRAILERSKDRMEKILELGNSSSPAPEKLRQFIQIHVAIGEENIWRAKIFFDQANIIPTRTFVALRKKEQKILQLLRDILKQGVSEGSFDIKDVKITSFAIMGMCNWTYRWYDINSKISSRQITNIFLNLIENGFLIKSPTAEGS